MEVRYLKWDHFGIFEGLNRSAVASACSKDGLYTATYSGPDDLQLENQDRATKNNEDFKIKDLLHGPVVMVRCCRTTYDRIKTFFPVLSRAVFVTRARTEDSRLPRGNQRRTQQGSRILGAFFVRWVLQYG